MVETFTNRKDFVKDATSTVLNLLTEQQLQTFLSWKYKLVLVDSVQTDSSSWICNVSQLCYCKKKRGNELLLNNREIMSKTTMKYRLMYLCDTGEEYRCN